MVAAIGYAANHFSSLGPRKFERRDLNPMDVQIEVLYCGVCHSDTHQAENDWAIPYIPACRATRKALSEEPQAGPAGRNNAIGRCPEWTAPRSAALFAPGPMAGISISSC